MKKKILPVALIASGYMAGEMDFNQARAIREEPIEEYTQLTVGTDGMFGPAFFEFVQQKICPIIDKKLKLVGDEKCDAAKDDWTISVNKNGEGALVVPVSVRLRGVLFRDRE